MKEGRKLFDTHHRSHKHPTNEGLITAVAFGGFLIVVGMVFALNPNLPQYITDFFSNITARTYPIDDPTSNFFLPAPANPSAHMDLYSTLIQFNIGIGILQIIILALRIAFHSKTDKIAETIGNLIFWFGAAFLVSTFLLTGTLEGWFTYWGALIVLIGITLIARAIVHFARR